MVSSTAEDPANPQETSPQPPSFKGSLERYTLDPTPQTTKPAPKPTSSTKKVHPFFNTSKRTSTEQKDPLSPSPSPIKKSKRTSAGYAPPSKYAHVNNLLTDSITPDLICLFIGLNPGIRTATSGHAYSHPSNLFWKLVHRSGCTPRLCLPTEDNDMPRLYALGLTNIVTRPTKDGAELSKQEMDSGVAELERKIGTFRPEAVAIVGKSIWESIWRVRHGRAIRKEEFRYGWQNDSERMGRERGKAVDGEEQKKWPGARMFVATTTSGLAASMSLQEKEAIWRELGSWVEQRRAERKEVEDGEAGATVEETLQ